MWETAIGILSVALTILSGVAGWFVRTHSTKLAHLQQENRDQERRQVELDKRLTVVEERSHAQKNTIVEIKDELAEIREKMVRREDITTLTDTIRELLRPRVGRNR